MDPKALKNNVLTAVITSAALGVLGFFMGVFEKGAAAMNEDQIEAVLDKYLVTDAGKTYAARISEIDSEVVVLETRVGILADDVEDLEDSLGVLVAE